jgi:ribonuclease P protein component
VTRSLLKRQIYAASGRHAAALPAGVWVVRLRAPFDRERFPSAASPALRLVARSELEALFTAAASAA